MSDSNYITRRDLILMDFVPTFSSIIFHFKPGLTVSKHLSVLSIKGSQRKFLETPSP